MPNENDSHDTPILDMWCQMRYIRAIKQTANKEGKMEVQIKSKEVAQAIAAQIERVTGVDCESYSSPVGSVIVLNDTTVIARITPLFSVMDITPVGGLFDGETATIPLKAETIDDIKEIAHAYDEAAAHVISAAVHH
jgi:hypothetical protein